MGRHKIIERKYSLEGEEKKDRGTKLTFDLRDLRIRISILAFPLP